VPTVNVQIAVNQLQLKKNSPISWRVFLCFDQFWIVLNVLVL